MSQGNIGGRGRTAPLTCTFSVASLGTFSGIVPRGPVVEDQVPSDEIRRDRLVIT